MPGLNSLVQNREMITSTLDTAWSPVAKMRMMSDGISPNNLLTCEHDELVGQKACLACGNCIDACPVVLREEDTVDLQAHRNSLHLEEIVGESCLRCYQCVQVCPQVDRTVKNYVTRHRITERMVHWWMAIAYLLTAGTGVSLYHFREDWSPIFILLISLSHKLGAIMWILSPFLFYYFDRYHFNRTLAAITSLGGKDFAWWGEFIKSVFGSAKRPFEGEYNSGQKTWYLVVVGGMLVLTITGGIRWVWEGSIPVATMHVINMIHIAAGVTVDVSLIYHFGRKLLVRTYKKTRRVFAGLPPFDVSAPKM